MPKENIDQNLNIKDASSQKSTVSALNKKISHLRVFVYIFVAISVLTTSLIVFLAYDPASEINFEAYYSAAPKNPVAYLYLSPPQGNYKIGEEFAIDVLMNTAGSNVNAVSSFLSYDKNNIEAKSIDLTGSVFDMTAESKILPDYGKIRIVIGTPTPGVSTQKGNMVKIATIHFMAKNKTSPILENITFDFTKGVSDFSAVFLDDKKGTDILDSTRGAKIFIN